MKILLINNSSGVHSALKKGLIEHGHEVRIVLSYCRNSHEREADIYPGNRSDSQLTRAVNRVKLIPEILRVGSDMDLINYIGTVSAFSFRGYFPHYRDLSIFRKYGVKLSYYGLACDEGCLPRVRDDVDNIMCGSCIAEDKLAIACNKTLLPLVDKVKKYSHNFDYCASSMREYDHCHALFNDEHTSHANIPLPIEVDRIEFLPAQNKRRPLIIHSPTRRGFKGTSVVIKAIEILSKMTEQFEFRLVEGLSYNDYVKTMADADIYIDQVHSYSAGMAALECMAMGKVVFTGNTPESTSFFDFPASSPAFNASSEPSKLANDLYDVLQRKLEYSDIAIAGRTYVKDNHHYHKVTERFLKLWSK